MEALLEQLIAAENTYNSIRFNPIGGTMEYEIDQPGLDAPLRIVAERHEVIQALLLLGFAKGHDPSTGVLYLPSYGASTLTEMMDRHGNDPHLQSYIFYQNLRSALYILAADVSAEWLYLRYFEDYTLTERCALLWRLANEPSIEDYQVSSVVQHLLNYLTETIPFLPRESPQSAKLFARWLKMTPGNLVSACLVAHPAHLESGYTTDVA